MLRRTKIIATLGPATDDEKYLTKVLDSGVNVVRINFSHGDADEHLARVKAVRKYAAKKHIFIGILMDLQGPKIRISSFKDGSINLNIDDEFILDADLDKNSGNKHSVGISYKELSQDVSIGSILLLDDGKIVMEVINLSGNKIICKVTQAGILYDKKGINLRGGGLSAHALTEKDKKDILIAAQAHADYVALSFPMSVDDVIIAKQLLREAGCDAGVIAKIERAEALKEGIIEKIIKESAGIMVARGDLGVEIGDPLLPAQQKRLIKLARQSDRIVITATQMLESMIHNPIPTRAEVFDVANAVLDGTDVVMLSAETAVGEFPDKAVRVMHDVCLEAEKNPLAKISHHRLHEKFNYIDETIAMSAMYAANHIGAKAVATLTQTGSTAMWMSRMSSNIPIFAMSDIIKTLRKVTLYRGVYPCYIDKKNSYDWEDINKKVINNLVTNKVVEDGDVVIVTKGLSRNESGGTNTMRVLKIGSNSY